MAVRSDSTQLIPGAVLSSAYAGFGVQGAAVPSGGTDGPSALYPCLSLPADNLVEFMGQITRTPVNGVLQANEDWSFTYTGTSDYCDFRLYIAGVAATADIGYGPGIVRIFFDQPGAMGTGPTSDDATVGGGFAGTGGGGGVMGAGPTVADATVGGSFGVNAAAMGAGPKAAEATVGGGFAGVGGNTKPGPRRVAQNISLADRSTNVSDSPRGANGSSARRPINRARN